VKFTVIRQVYNQKIAYIKNRKHSCIFCLLSLTIFREYRYLKMSTALFYSSVICKW